MKHVVAIIPARGGSKQVPGKNLRRVGGVALVARAVAAARRCPAIEHVLVTTDDDDIAAVASEWGAEIVRRPAELAGDTASSESALLHALETLAERGWEPQVVAFLQATSPFIDVEALDRAIGLVRTGRRDIVFSAVETYGFLWEKSTGGAVSAVNHDATRRPRRQDRDPQHLETGGFYVMRSEGFRAAGHRFFGSIGVVAVPARTAIEIDTEEDLDVARALAPLIDAHAPIDVDAVVTDFDGVHTDDSVLVDQDGVEAVTVSRADGLGVSLLRRAGIPVLILSTEVNAVVGARARKLRADVRQGLDDKSVALREWAHSRGIRLSRIAYVGNDVNDLACLELVGWPVATADAHPLVRSAARVVLSRAGGEGAVRELADRVLAGRIAEPFDKAIEKQEAP